MCKGVKDTNNKLIQQYWGIKSNVDLTPVQYIKKDKYIKILNIIILHIQETHMIELSVFFIKIQL